MLAQRRVCGWIWYSVMVGTSRPAAAGFGGVTPIVAVDSAGVQAGRPIVREIPGGGCTTVPVSVAPWLTVAVTLTGDPVFTEFPN